MQLLSITSDLAKNPYVMYPLCIAAGPLLTMGIKEVSQKTGLSIELPTNFFHRYVTTVLPDNIPMIALGLSRHIDKIPFLSPLGGKTQFYAKIAATVLVSSFVCDLIRSWAYEPIKSCCNKIRSTLYLGTAIRIYANCLTPSDSDPIN
jgi:hypothetical protein